MRRLVTALIIFLAGCVAAFAHPHVWTDMRTALMANAQGLITGIRIEWTFDEGYSGFALEGLDTNADGVFDPEEIRPLTEENIKSLEESDYFAFMRFKGALQPIGAVTDYVQTYANNRLTLAFVLPLKTPVDLRQGEFQYKVYDPDFFIAFDYVKDDPAELEGTLPTGCSFELKPFLTDEEIEAKRDYLATKGKDWKPDQEEDFGALFARAAVATCGGTTSVVSATGSTSVEIAKPEASAGPVIDKSKLIVPPRNADGSFVETPFAENPVRWLRDKQQNFYRSLQASVKAIQGASPLSALWTLISIGFLYGVFHAAGPGHGKAVVSAWVLATENELKRGIAIAGLSALFQALTAIAIVTGLVLFVSSASALARDVAGFLESASYLMIAAMGLYLLWNAQRPRRTVAVRNAPSTEHRFELVSRPESGAEFNHVHDEHCGHLHAPSPAEVKGDWSWWRAVTLAFAVGLRPCTGALLVLIFAWTAGIYWAGVLATLAMGFGVFLTIAVIAALSVYGKSLAKRLTALDSKGMAMAAKATRALCGLVLAALGGLLFWASLGAAGGMA